MDESRLEFRQADDNDRLEIYRAVFDVWPCGSTVEEHLHWRLNSPQHQQAIWYCGRNSQGELVTSAGRYPLSFWRGGRVVPGFAIGAVHTLPKYRGRGAAPLLIEWMEQQASAEGSELSLLFSDIAPAYYGCMGYQRCPANQGELNRANVVCNKLVDTCSLEWPRDRDWIETVYRNQIQQQKLAIERSPAEWEHLLNVFRETCWLGDGLPDQATTWIAYRQRQNQLTLLDWASQLRGEEQHQRVRDLLKSALFRCDAESIAGWMPAAWASAEVTITERSEEISMLKSLNNHKLSREELSAAGLLRSLNHV